MLLQVSAASILFDLTNLELHEVISSSKELATADKPVEDRQETTIKTRVARVHQLFLSVMPCCTFLGTFVLISSPYFPS